MADIFKKIDKITTFKLCVRNAFPYIEADFDALDNYQLLCKVVEYLNKVITSTDDVIDNVDLLHNEFVNLKNYVDNYLTKENLQPMINDKLDEMAEDGTLERLIGQYIDVYIERAFTTVAAMKYENLEVDVKCRTLGYYSVNDGGSAQYIIRENEPISKFYEVLNNGKYAELILENNTINVKQIGLKTNDETAGTENSSKLQAIINLQPYEKTIYFPADLYYFSSAIDLKTRVTLKGDYNFQYYGTNDNALRFQNCNGFINGYHSTISHLNIESTVKANSGITSKGNTKIAYCTIHGFETGIDGNAHSVTVTNCQINENTYGIRRIIDSKVISNTINSNDWGIYLSGNDNIISENKIEWNNKTGITAYACGHNVINNNLFDRNNDQGLFLSESHTTTITGNLFRRNGVTSEGDEQCQIKLYNSRHLTINSNMTLTYNSEDDESGVVVPLYAINMKQCQNSILHGNDLTGGTHDKPFVYTSNSNINELNLGYNLFDKLKTTITTYKTIPKNSSSTVTIAGELSGNYAPPKYKHLQYSIRSTSNAFYEVGEFYIYNYNAGSITAKSSISEIGPNLSINVSYDTNTNKYIITLSNSNTNYDYVLNLYEIV